MDGWMEFIAFIDTSRHQLISPFFDPRGCFVKIERNPFKGRSKTQSWGSASASLFQRQIVHSSSLEYWSNHLRAFPEAFLHPLQKPFHSLYFYKQNEHKTNSRNKKKKSLLFLLFLVNFLFFFFFPKRLSPFKRALLRRRPWRWTQFEGSRVP